jgi:hypothetical protein
MAFGGLPVKAGCSGRNKLRQVMRKWKVLSRIQGLPFFIYKKTGIAASEKFLSIQSPLYLMNKRLLAIGEQFLILLAYIDIDFFAIYEVYLQREQKYGLF